MSDALWAARLGDALNHTSMMADILGGVLELSLIHISEPTRPY